MEESDQHIQANKVRGTVRVATDAQKSIQDVRENTASKFTVRAERQATFSFGRYKVAGKFAIVALVLVLVAGFLIRAYFLR
jgi:hypothetical protein